MAVFVLYAPAEYWQYAGHILAVYGRYTGGILAVYCSILAVYCACVFLGFFVSAVFANMFAVSKP